MSNSISLEQLTLYYSPTCPYCHRVLDAMQALGLNPDLANGTASGITLKDRKNTDFLNELVNGGGKKTVPCLLIKNNNQEQWMYESLDIVAFLKENFA